MVKVVQSELVVPTEETPRHSIWVSNLDLAARRGYTPTVYFYRANGDHSNFFSVEILKSTLAKTLVPFYPFAGRLGMDTNGRIEIACTGEGAVFVVAHSEYTLEDLDDFHPSNEMRDIFIPTSPSADISCPLVMIQVTFLKCGGVVLGAAMHHTVIDARSASHFMETWATVTRGGHADAIPPPFFDHTPLRARSSPTVLYDHPEYTPDSVPVSSRLGSTYSSAVLPLSKAHVDLLKLRSAASGDARVSTFRAIVALLWRCVVRARNLSPDTPSRLYTMIDMRSRMSPPLPTSYVGNAVIRTSVVATAEELIANPLGYAARKLRSATNQGDEFARSLIDYLESMDMMKLPRNGVSKADLRVISWLGMSMHDADFGWGEPSFMGPALMYYPGFVNLLNSPKKDGGVSIIISLEPESMPTFRSLFMEELASLDLDVQNY